jgi:hypothetical protein
LANIYLGVSGSEITLPQTRWLGGDTPEAPIAYHIPVERSMTLAGTVRYNFRTGRQRTWPLEFTDVSLADLTAMLGLCALNQSLRYQNNWYSSTWYTVVITSFAYNPLNPAVASADVRYLVTMTLEEVA